MKSKLLCITTALRLLAQQRAHPAAGLWRFTTPDPVLASPTLARDGTIHFGCNDSKLYALHPDGTKKWDFTAGGAIGSSPALAMDGTVYFGCDDGKLYAIDANGNELWNFQTGGAVFASPVIGPDGTVYFASTDGVLYTVSGCRPPALSDWPMFQHDAQRTGRTPPPLTNQPPVLAPIPDWTIGAGATLVVTNFAADPDSPAQSLRFALGLGAPAGAAIDPTNGVFVWTPAEADVPSTNEIRIVVTDDGSPSLTEVQCFTVIVVARPRIESIVLEGPTVALTWQAVPSSTYRVQYKTNLHDAAWNDLPGDVTTNGPIASKSDPWNSATPQRFYRVELLP